MNNKKLSTWEAACIITGYGIGAGVLSMPYMAKRNGILTSFIILTLALIASYILHLMIAEIALKSGKDSQIISCLEKFLFKGKFKKVLSISFFILMGAILITNLATYISGASDVISSLIPISSFASNVIFYLIAASVVLFGLKAVGLSEKYAVSAIFGLIAILTIASLLKIRNPLSFNVGTINEALAYFGLAMFAMSAFFSVPQAVNGLDSDIEKIRKSIFLGLFNNYIMIIVITVASLLSSFEVTELSMIGWSKGIGTWAQIIGSIFTILAMLTTYWSLSLALADIVKEMLKISSINCWLLATIPSFIMANLGLGSFMELMRLAGGLIAIVIAIMIVPTYHKARSQVKENNIITNSNILFEVIIILAYVLMAIGSVVPV